MELFFIGFITGAVVWMITIPLYFKKIRGNGGGIEIPEGCTAVIRKKTSPDEPDLVIEGNNK